MHPNEHPIEPTLLHEQSDLLALSFDNHSTHSRKNGLHVAWFYIC